MARPLENSVDDTVFDHRTTLHDQYVIADVVDHTQIVRDEHRPLRPGYTARRDRDRGTSRKKATGRDRLPDSHPAAAYRGALTARYPHSDTKCSATE